MYRNFALISLIDKFKLASLNVTFHKLLTPTPCFRTI